MKREEERFGEKCSNYVLSKLSSRASLPSKSETTLARQSKLPARTCLPCSSALHSLQNRMLLPHRTAWTTPLEFQSVFSDLFESDESRQLIALSRVSQHSLIQGDSWS